MCWFSKTLEKKIAPKEGVKVFKVVSLIDDKISSYYMRNSEYKLNCLKTSVIRIEKHSLFYVCNVALHSYSSEHCNYRISVVFDSPIIRIFTNEEGIIDAYYFPEDDLCIMECIIPEGATYYENSCGEIISDKLIPTKLIEI